jgi:transcriptional regulator with XRE-family HTH domain|tara:strand:+ start:176 stop:397 length:222 start_codon:yes stop_codon:yes gene_type:complete
MKLSDWIKENKLSYSQAANKFGIININPATNVQRYAKGERIPHPKVMLKIFKATNKKVQPNDFYEEYWQREEV